MVVLLGFGGFYFYKQQSSQQTPDKIAKDTGTQEIQKDDLAKYNKEAQEYEAKYKYTEVFDSWDALDDAKDKDDSYALSKYEGKKLYLVYAALQEDNKIAAVFSDKNIVAEKSEKDK